MTEHLSTRQFTWWTITLQINGDFIVSSTIKWLIQGVVSYNLAPVTACALLYGVAIFPHRELCQKRRWRNGHRCNCPVIWLRHNYTNLGLGGEFAFALRCRLLVWLSLVRTHIEYRVQACSSRQPNNDLQPIGRRRRHGLLANQRLAILRRKVCQEQQIDHKLYF